MHLKDWRDILWEKSIILMKEKLLMKKQDYFKQIAKELGKQGGEKTLEKYGKEHFSSIGKSKKPKKSDE